MRLAPLSLLSLVAASGCAGTRWSVVDARPLVAVSVAAVETRGPVDRTLVAERHQGLVNELRAHGYAVLDQPAPGVPTLTMKVAGELVDDSRLHAPDDPRHHIYNDLHYQFVAYDVHVDVTNAFGKIVVCGSAKSNQDPAGAVDELVARLVHDVPPATGSLAAR